MLLPAMFSEAEIRLSIIQVRYLFANPASNKVKSTRKGEPRRHGKKRPINTVI